MTEIPSVCDRNFGEIPLPGRRKRAEAVLVNEFHGGVKVTPWTDRINGGMSRVSLQSPDLGSDGRLREMKLPSCFRDFADLGNNQKGM